jgi:hypothetical protein
MATLELLLPVNKIHSSVNGIDNPSRCVGELGELAHFGSGFFADESMLRILAPERNE